MQKTNTMTSSKMSFFDDGNDDDDIEDDDDDDEDHNGDKKYLNCDEQQNYSFFLTLCSLHNCGWVRSPLFKQINNGRIQFSAMPSNDHHFKQLGCFSSERE